MRLLSSGRARAERRRRGDLWATTAKIGSSAWVEGRVLGVITNFV
ncbi:hypothetical protein Taro_046917 [Colocasia esculenta]|uniref:Uncharacterized protein n=1 Tax=Colocasia esculenta TaxID=4460 RepID=A0A843X4S3_COLES|nr:hypothetical protein [Colocasia esculenta]